MRSVILVILGLTNHQISCSNDVTDGNENGGLISLDDCVYFCDTSNNDIHEYIPPAFDSPCTPTELLSVYVTAPGERGINISWTEPEAFDKNGTLLRNEQMFGARNGSYFNGSVKGMVYDIVYVVTDANGLKASCHFNFTVFENLNCTAPGTVENGKYECAKGTTPGSTCKFTCNEGYKMTGDTHVTCIKQESAFPVWSGNPACEAIQCGEPTKPINGNISCSSASFSYLSVCHITCETGFTADGPLIMICQADGSWSRSTFCTFPEPLAIHCISPQVFYTSPQQTSVQVHWQDPTSFALDSNLIQMRKTDGPNQGDILDVGLYTVTYELTNGVSRETAECDVQLHVKVVLCEEPSTALNDSFMVHQCSLPTLILGTNCIISCQNGMELIGNSSVICVDNGTKNGIWDWGHSYKPFCNNTIQNCTQYISDPGNGKLVYGENDTSPMVQVVCDTGFSLPLGFSEIVFCLDGKWEYDQIPSCNAEMKPDYKMKVQVMFNGQGCSDNASIYYEKYEETFQVEFEKILIHNCSSETLCTVDDVGIECYNKSTQSTREVSHLDDYQRMRTQIFSLTFTLRAKAAENTSDNLNIDQENFVKSLWGYYRQWVVSTILGMLSVYGDFVVEGWNIANFTIPTCKQGYILQEHQCSKHQILTKNFGNTSGLLYQTCTGVTDRQPSSTIISYSY